MGRYVYTFLYIFSCWFLDWLAMMGTLTYIFFLMPGLRELILRLYIYCFKFEAFYKFFVHFVFMRSFELVFSAIAKLSNQLLSLHISLQSWSGFVPIRNHGNRLNNECRHGNADFVWLCFLNRQTAGVNLCLNFWHFFAMFTTALTAAYLEKNFVTDVLTYMGYPQDHQKVYFTRLNFEWWRGDPCLRGVKLWPLPFVLLIAGRFGRYRYPTIALLIFWY